MDLVLSIINKANHGGNIQLMDSTSQTTSSFISATKGPKDTESLQPVDSTSQTTCPSLSATKVFQKEEQCLNTMPTDLLFDTHSFPDSSAKTTSTQHKKPTASAMRKKKEPAPEYEAPTLRQRKQPVIQAKKKNKRKNKKLHKKNTSLSTQATNVKMFNPMKCMIAKSLYSTVSSFIPTPTTATGAALMEARQRRGTAEMTTKAITHWSELTTMWSTGLRENVKRGDITIEKILYEQNVCISMKTFTELTNITYAGLQEYMNDVLIILSDGTGQTFKELCSNVNAPITSSVVSVFYLYLAIKYIVSDSVFEKMIDDIDYFTPRPFVLYKHLRGI